MSEIDTIKMIDDRILVRPDDPKTQSKGGILLPDNGQEKPLSGTVIAVGQGRITENGACVSPSVGVDDKVLFGQWSGADVVLDGEKLKVMKESDIFAFWKTQ